MTASYIKHGRGESIRSLDAKADGRYPASYWAKKIGKGVTAKDIVSALGYSEWHHTGKYASRTPFYEADDFECEERMAAIFAARDKRKGLTAKTFTATVTIVDFFKSGKRWKATERTITGEMSVKGDWLILPSGERVNKDGNRVKMLLKLS